MTETENRIENAYTAIINFLDEVPNSTVTEAAALAAFLGTTQVPGGQSPKALLPSLVGLAIGQTLAFGQLIDEAFFDETLENLERNLTELFNTQSNIWQKIDAINVDLISLDNNLLELEKVLTNRMNELNTKQDEYLKSLDNLEKATNAYIKCLEE